MYTRRGMYADSRVMVVPLLAYLVLVISFSDNFTIAEFAIRSRNSEEARSSRHHQASGCIRRGIYIYIHIHRRYRIDWRDR